MAVGSPDTRLLVTVARSEDSDTPLLIYFAMSISCSALGRLSALSLARISLGVEEFHEHEGSRLWLHLLVMADGTD